MFPTEQETYHRLRWDPRFDVSRCSIVYTLRPEGTKRVAFAAWDEAVPWHRIIEFWVGDELAWSRPQRIDRLDAIAGRAAVASTLGQPLVGRGAPAAPPEMAGVVRVAFWNLLFDRYDDTGADHTPRWRAALDELAARGVDLAVLAEVTPAMWQVIASHDGFGGFAASHGSADVAALTPYGQVVLSRWPIRAAHALALSRDKRATMVVLEAGLGVAAVHLTSNRKPDALASRREQIEQVAGAIRGTPCELGWVIAGDFNGPPGEVAVDGVDAWTSVHGDAPGMTFDPPANPLAAAQSRTGQSARLDRIYACGAGLLPVACELVTAQVSDHHAVIADIAVGVGRLALAVVPPGELWGPIQRVRCAEDSKFAKWPPHLTVALPWDGEVVPRVAPFEVSLERIVSLQANVHALVPVDASPFRALGVHAPHLTLSRSKSPPEMPPRLPAWRADGVEVLVEHRGRFRRLDELRARPADPAVLEAMRRVAPAATLTVFGSMIYAPECASDLDVAVASESDAARIASKLGFRAAGANHWRGELGGTHIDLLVGGPETADDARRLREHLEHHGRVDAFVAALPRVQAYAHARGLFGDALGYLGTYGWALALADALAHDEELCAVSPDAAFDAWFAALPRIAVRLEETVRDIGRFTTATRRTFAAELRAPSHRDLAGDPPPGDILELDRDGHRGRMRALVGALEDAGLAPRVWGRRDDAPYRISVGDLSAASRLVS